MLGKRWFHLAVILLIAGAVYAPVSQAYFVGFDDFYVIHRTAFEDTPHPAGMITTSHFSSAKYRPGARLLDYIVYHLGNGRPLAFRLRNIICHLGVSVLIYILGMDLFASPAIAFSSALLFALHPLANQSTLAASWTVTPAALLLVGSLVLFIRATRSTHWVLWLVCALLTLVSSLFIYEAGIVMVGVWAVFLLSELPSRKFLAAVVLGLGLVLGGFFLARAMVVENKPQRGSMGSIAKNLILYTGGLLASPADSILAHDLFGAPLPSEISLEDESFLIPLVTAASTITFLALLLWRRIRSHDGTFSEPFPWLRLLMLAASIPLWLIPFLLFTPHASETYLYLPAASASLFVAAILHYTLRSQTSFAVAIGLLALLFGAATFNRNRRVIESAKVAERIVSEFPIQQWKSGAWDVRVAEADPVLPRYGLYSYQGLATIDPGEPSIPAAEYALQLATANPGLSVRVISPAEMAATPCPSPHFCYWVHADGRVTPTVGAPQTP